MVLCKYVTAMDDVNKLFNKNYTEQDSIDMNPYNSRSWRWLFAVARDKYGAKSFGEMAAIYNGGLLV